MVNFKIVIPAYNSIKWIEKCLDSIKAQTYKNYNVCVVDDLSTDGQRDVVADYCKKNNWISVLNNERMFTLFNIQLGIESHKCNDDDVIVMVDGDDWLYDDTVLEKVNKAYDKDIYLTYGQYIGTSGNDSKYFCFRPDQTIIDKKLYRKVPWLFTHLKTFKYKLFKCIRKQHFIDRDGKYFKTTSDLAIMFPMVEMCGNKFKCLNDILYVYNEDNPISDFRSQKAEQARVDGVIRRFPVYPTIV